MLIPKEHLTLEEDKRMICHCCGEVIEGNYREVDEGGICFDCWKLTVTSNVKDDNAYKDGYEAGFHQGRIDAFNKVLTMLKVGLRRLERRS